MAAGFPHKMGHCKSLISPHLKYSSMSILREGTVWLFLDPDLPLVLPAGAGAVDTHACGGWGMVPHLWFTFQLQYLSKSEKLGFHKSR